jgi:hypothetical protein
VQSGFSQSFVSNSAAHRPRPLDPNTARLGLVSALQHVRRYLTPGHIVGSAACAKRSAQPGPGGSSFVESWQLAFFVLFVSVCAMGVGRTAAYPVPIQKADGRLNQQGWAHQKTPKSGPRSGSPAESRLGSGFGWAIPE